MTVLLFGCRGVGWLDVVGVVAGLRAERAVVPLHPGAYRVRLGAVAIQKRRAGSTRGPHAAAPRAGLPGCERRTITRRSVVRANGSRASCRMVSVLSSY